MYCMHKKKPQKPPKHTSENFWGCAPKPPLTQSILWVPLSVFALGPLNPVGGPASSQYKIKGINKLKNTVREWNSVVNHLRSQTGLSARKFYWMSVYINLFV